MSEEAVVELQNNEQEQQDNNKQEERDLNYWKSLAEQAQEKLNAVAKKKDELLHETKRAKLEREQAEKQKSAKDNEYAQLKQELENFKKEIKHEKISNHALKLATELAKQDGGTSARLLSKLLKEDIEKHLEEFGEINESVLSDIRKDAEKNYGPLLAGSQATGGGAAGNMSSARKTSEEENLSAIERLNAYHMKQINRGK